MITEEFQALVLLCLSKGWTKTAIAKAMDISKQNLNLKMKTGSKVESELWERCKKLRTDILKT